MVRKTAAIAALALSATLAAPVAANAAPVTTGGYSADMVAGGYSADLVAGGYSADLVAGGYSADLVSGVSLTGVKSAVVSKESPFRAPLANLMQVFGFGWLLPNFHNSIIHQMILVPFAKITGIGLGH